MRRRYDLRRSDNYIYTGSISHVCSGSGSLKVYTGFPVTRAFVSFATLPIPLASFEISSTYSASTSSSSTSSESSVLYSSSSSSSTSASSPSSASTESAGNVSTSSSSTSYIQEWSSSSSTSYVEEWSTSSSSLSSRSSASSASSYVENWSSSSSTSSSTSSSSYILGWSTSSSSSPSTSSESVGNVSTSSASSMSLSSPSSGSTSSSSSESVGNSSTSSYICECISWICSGDTTICSRIEGKVLTGLNTWNTDNCDLYFTFSSDTYDHLVVVSAYKDAARTELTKVAEGHGYYDTGGNIIISERNDSGVSGVIHITAGSAIDGNVTFTCQTYLNDEALHDAPYGLPRIYVSGYTTDGFYVNYEYIPASIGYLEFNYWAV